MTGCAVQSSIPVVEVKQPPSEKISTHFVSSGDTLYSIAWRYNLDPESLASANNIKKPYKIYKGDKINLQISYKPLNQNKMLANKSLTKEDVKVKPTANLKSVQDKWFWPAKGKITRDFNDSRLRPHKGIDIKSFKGAPVFASNSGSVVYSGSGLPAYGKLIIIKHNDIFLSAYAHNDQLLVKEGDQVMAGEKIAEIGQTGTKYVHLHFEIRKNGVPINPNLFLSKQG